MSMYGLLTCTLQVVYNFSLAIQLWLYSFYTSQYCNSFLPTLAEIATDEGHSAVTEVFGKNKKEESYFG